MTELAVGLVMIVGLAGTLLPILPGPLVMWLAAVAYGLAEGFGLVGFLALALITLLLLWGAWLSVRIPQRRAAGSGLSIRAQVLAAVFAVVGFFVIPVVGAAVGFVGGVFLIRYTRERDVAGAWESTRSALGSLWRAAAAQFGTGVAAAAVWLVWALSG